MKYIYNTDSAILKDLHLKEYGAITKLAGGVGDEFVRVHPVVPERYARVGFYLGIGFNVWYGLNVIKFKTDYPAFNFIKGDSIIIYFQNLDAIKIDLDGAMASLSDNQLDYLNEHLVSHIEYYSKSLHLTTTCRFSDTYNCQYENAEDGAELLRVTAMRICGVKMILIYRHVNQIENIVQYSLIK